jgi:hypothetical protein
MPTGIRMMITIASTRKASSFFQAVLIPATDQMVAFAIWRQIGSFPFPI